MVAMGVWIRVEAGLEDWIGRGFDNWDHVRGGESNLLDFRKVILWVLGETQLPEAPEWDLFLKPDFREVHPIKSMLDSFEA